MSEQGDKLAAQYHAALDTADEARDAMTGAATPRKQCAATRSIAGGWAGYEDEQCLRPAGHDGMHNSGNIEWPNLPSPAGAGEATQFAWLMERPVNGRPAYWNGGHAESFTHDPWKAVRFATRAAAMAQCPPEHYAQWGWRYIEHGFVSLAPAGAGGAATRVATIEGSKAALVSVAVQLARPSPAGAGEATPRQVSADAPDWIPRCSCGNKVLNQGDACSTCEPSPAGAGEAERPYTRAESVASGILMDLGSVPVTDATVRWVAQRIEAYAARPPASGEAERPFSYAQYFADEDAADLAQRQEHAKLQAHDRLLTEVGVQLAKAEAKHAPMRGAHEGYAVILEELDELWEEVKWQTIDPAALRKEALHVAAMALRFVKDVCDAK